MDDTNMTMLSEAQFEWALRLVHLLQPHIYEGVHTMYQEALQLCRSTDEEEKYLMTFQNFLARIPKWSSETVDQEVARIVDKSGCTYLEDLITCVHITHLKMLTSIRTGKTQKKIDIAIPKLGVFVHKVYTNTSRALYLNVFLVDKDIPALLMQKNKSEFNKLIKTAILDAVRESIPIEQLLRSYLDESTDLVKEEVKSEAPPPPAPAPVEEVVVPEPPAFALKEVEVVAPAPARAAPDPVVELLERPTLKFADIDSAISVDNVPESIVAPKTIDRLEEISRERNAARKLEEAADAGDTLQIGGDVGNLDLGITVLS